MHRNQLLTAALAGLLILAGSALPAAQKAHAVRPVLPAAPQASIEVIVPEEAPGPLRLAQAAAQNPAAAAPPAEPAPAPATPEPTPAPATPQTTRSGDEGQHKNRFRFGPEVGLFLPTDSKTRDRFGSTWLSFGFGIGQIGPLNPAGNLAFDLHFLYQKRGDNHALLVPIGLAYIKALADPKQSSTYPYVGVDADLYLADIKSVQDNIGSGLRTGAGGGGFLGLNFGDTAYLEARYQAVSRIKGFDFSGLSLSAGYRF